MTAEDFAAVREALEILRETREFDLAAMSRYTAALASIEERIAQVERWLAEAQKDLLFVKGERDDYRARVEHFRSDPLVQALEAAERDREHIFHVESEKWYEGLDPGVRFPVRVLHARGIETGQSCEGGNGHAYDRPTIDLLGATRGAGFSALAALEEYGLRVRDVALLWTVTDGLPSEQFWRITLWQAWSERAREVPMFVWRYEVTP